MAITILPFHHGLRLQVKTDQAPPIKIPASGIILLVGTAPIGPVQTPTLLIGSLAEAVSLFGAWQPWHAAAGFTIPEALAGIFAQGAATVVVINTFDPTTLFATSIMLLPVIDRRGVLKLERQTLTSTILTVATTAKITVPLPPSGTLAVTIPRNYTAVTGVNTTTLGALTLAYVAGTGVVTVTAGAAAGESITLTVTATWSPVTDYTLDTVAGTLTIVPGGRMLPGMILTEVDAVYPTYASANIAARHAAMIGVVGATTRTGFKAAETVPALLHVTPKIIICPRLTDRDLTLTHIASPVVVEMDRVAKMLGARAFVSAEEGLTLTNFVATCGMFADPDSRIGSYSWPHVKVAANNGVIYNQPASAVIAGAQAVVDASEGFHESVSNRKLQGVLGVEQTITHSWTETNTQSNYANENGGVVIVSEQGYYKAHGVWQPNLEMLSVLRTADMLNVAIVDANRWVLDKALNRERPRQVMQRVKALFRGLEADGVLIPNPSPDSTPDIWLDPTINTPDRMALGKFAYSYRFNPPPLMTDVSFIAHITRDYLTSFVKTLTV